MVDSTMNLRTRLDRATNKLCKWRGVYAGWWFGTRSIDDPQAKAARDNFDRTIMLRCEVSALTALLIEKGAFTLPEFEQRLLTEVEALDRMLEEAWPGIKTTDVGVTMEPSIAIETMRQKGFPA